MCAGCVCAYHRNVGDASAHWQFTYFDVYIYVFAFSFAYGELQQLQRHLWMSGALAPKHTGAYFRAAFWREIKRQVAFHYSDTWNTIDLLISIAYTMMFAFKMVVRNNMRDTADPWPMHDNAAWLDFGPEEEHFDHVEGTPHEGTHAPGNAHIYNVGKS